MLSRIIICFSITLLPFSLLAAPSDQTVNSELEEDSNLEAAEKAREREASAEEDPLEKIKPDEILPKGYWLEEPNDFSLYGSIRVRYRETRNDSVWSDSGSRVGADGKYQVKPQKWVFGRAEAGINLLDEPRFIFSPSDQPSDGEEGRLFLRLAYVGIETPSRLVTAGKNWSTYYKVASFTDRFLGTGASASGVFNAGTDGGSTGTGRADWAIQSRFDFGLLSNRLHYKPFNVNIQAQYGRAIPHIEDAKYDLTLGLSATFNTSDNLAIGIAFNHANINDRENPNLLQAGIDGDALAGLLGVRWFADKWYLGTTVSRLENHEATNQDIYFDGWGWEVYGQYKLHHRIWAVAGWNILHPDRGQRLVGEYQIEYGVLGARYTFDKFKKMIYFNVQLENSRTAAGLPTSNVYTIGVQWDLP